MHALVDLTNIHLCTVNLMRMYRCFGMLPEPNAHRDNTSYWMFMKLIIKCQLISYYQQLQGESRLVCPLLLLISLAYVDDMKYPLNHLIIYEGEFFWHIKHHDHFIISWVKSKNVFDKVLPEMVCVCPCPHKTTQNQNSAMLWARANLRSHLL